ncbi:phosphatidylglycerophosphatase and protein-tyrosine phosphatase 1 isoform X2 [Dermochelys coriacea]|uniref:phosphatidylglycerophosphatase and protein-tyrosine phosphatase 1 isoform X2 n=1 Tax=Dermochelys coriacea TaxID=27794 RepID=UPI0018E85473|nr:phosphatidylglycerophosphatase and protein-tyrosine phosphatase 1 isoform X2 [Dermochelys coriacea]
MRVTGGPGSLRDVASRSASSRITVGLGTETAEHQLVAEENVRGVLTLNEEYETRFLCCSAQEYEAMGVEQLRLGTVDLTGVPTLENLQRGVEFVLKHRECGNSVYVHCKAGRSRSATMVAAYLIQLYQWSPQEAIEAIARIRPHILVRPRQVQVLERFHRNVIAEAAAESQQELPETIHLLPTTRTSSS